MDTVLVLGIVGVILAVAVASIVKRSKSKSSCCSGAGYQAKTRKLRSVAEKRTYRVEGMHCQHCVNRVMESVQDIPGTSASVNLKKGTVTVAMEASVEDSIVRAAIEKGGYTVTGVI